MFRCTPNTLEMNDIWFVYLYHVLGYTLFANESSHSHSYTRMDWVRALCVLFSLLSFIADFAIHSSFTRFHTLRMHSRCVFFCSFCSCHIYTICVQGATLWILFSTICYVSRTAFLVYVFVNPVACVCVCFGFGFYRIWSLYECCSHS